MSRLLVIQPWVAAKGHPAQSLLNTARALEHCDNVRYLISDDGLESSFLHVANELSKLAPVDRFHVNSSSLQEGTFKSLMSLLKQRKALKGTTILFLDGHLIVFAL